MGRIDSLVELNVKYPVFRVKNTKIAEQIYSQLFGFQGTASFQMFDAVVVKDTHSLDKGFVLARNSSSFCYSFLKTSNCILDTLRLKKSGYQCIEPPVSTMLGLASKFQDEFGNVIILLEEREYS